MFKIHEAIEDLRSVFDFFVIESRNLSIQDYCHKYGRQMAHAVNTLEYRLKNELETNLDVREALRKDALVKWRPIEEPLLSPVVPFGPPEPKSNLTRKQKKALDFIRAKGPIKGISVARHIGVAEITFRRHYAKVLKTFGVQNDGGGYYIFDQDKGE